MPVIEIEFGIKKHEYIGLSDFAYGEFLIFLNGAPKFYYSVFGIQEQENGIASYALQQNIPFEDLLIKILVLNGYEGAYFSERPTLMIEQDNKSYLKEFELLEIVDFSD